VAGLRAGIAGAGLMGRWHAHAVRRAGGQVVAVADPNLVAARALASRHPGAAVHAAGADLVAAGGLDVLHVCSPLPTHAPLIEAALAAGVHVLAEKPLAADLESTRHLLAAADRHGVLLCPVHQFLFQEGVGRARVSPSPVGDLRHIEVTICTAGADDAPPEHWDELLADVLPHPLSLAQVLLRGGLTGAEFRARRPVPSDLIVEADRDGIALRVLVSLRARPTQCELLLRGEAGTLLADLFHGYAFLEAGDVSRGRKILRPFRLGTARLWAAGRNLVSRGVRGEPAYPGLRGLIRAFHQAAARGGPAPIPPADVLAVAAGRDAIIATTLPGAATSGRTVRA